MMRRLRSGCDVHEAGAVGEGDGLDAVAETQLGENVIDVRFDRRFAEEQRTGDFGVGAAAGQESQYLELAGGELVELGRRGDTRRRALDEALKQAAGYFRREQRIS